MKDNRITIRFNEEEKEKILMIAKRNNMTISKYIKNIVNENTDTEGLLDSEKRFLKLFEIGFETYYEPYHNQIITNQNINAIDTKTIIEQNNIMYKQIDLPQTIDEIKIPLYNHPITDLAREKTIKTIRKSKMKEDVINE